MRLQDAPHIIQTRSLPPAHVQSNTHATLRARFDASDEPTEEMRRLCADVLSLLWIQVQHTSDAAGLPRTDSLDSLLQFGRTKVFMKRKLVHLIALTRERHLEFIHANATTLQSFMRMVIARSRHRTRLQNIRRAQAMFCASVQRSRYLRQQRGILMLRTQARAHTSQNQPSQ